EIRTRAVQRREVIRSVQDSPARLEPVCHEAALKLRDDRAGYFVMIIAPMLWRIGVAAPKISDAGATDEADPAIDNQQFPVTAVIVTPRIGPESGVIFHDLHTRAAQARQILAAHLARALRVKDCVYVDSRPRALSQRFCKLAPGLAVPKDICFEVDRTLGRTNGVQHRRENLITVDECGDAVPLYKIRAEQRAGRLPEFG